MAPRLFACFGSKDRRGGGASPSTVERHVTKDLTAEEQKRSGPVLVEMFSSQGCVTSPAAELVLSRLGRGDFGLEVPVIVLIFHVDYWDYKGWKDPFGSSQWTVRQKAYVESLGLDTMFTPQVVVQGKVQCVGNDENALIDAIITAPRFPAPTFKVQYTQEKNQQTIVAITDLQCYNGEEAKNQNQHSTMEESHFQQLPFQSPESEAAKQITTNLKFNTEQEMAIEAEIHHHSTAKITEPKIESEEAIDWKDPDVEVAASMKGKGETVALPDPREASLELVVEVDTRETVKAETRGSLAATNAGATNGARGPRSRSSGDWHRRTLFVAKPAVLVAAVFPWDREREALTPKNHGLSVENDDIVLTVEGIAVPIKLIVEEKVSMVAGLAVVENGAGRVEARVVGSRALMKMDGGIVQVDPPWLPTREKNLRKTQEDDAVHVGTQQRKLLVEAQPQLFLLGLSWALEFHSIGLTFLGPKKGKDKCIFWINGYIRIVWDPGGRFLFYALG